ncbi:hypothetical protein EVAR_32398_1 [Eumeta japonica]|uniref:Uncharacterized protein n=1 Tax=Eumeta variegata TaxID=151549 RepID=A0A4C1VKF0_EUMVA|nr:hypothetical protein EVAR_32398_1 [Eumeta japonica]
MNGPTITSHACVDRTLVDRPSLSTSFGPVRTIDDGFGIEVTKNDNETRVALPNGAPYNRSKGRQTKRWEDDLKKVAGPLWLHTAKQRNEWKALEEAFAERQAVKRGEKPNPENRN